MIFLVFITIFYLGKHAAFICLFHFFFTYSKITMKVEEEFPW